MTNLALKSSTGSMFPIHLVDREPGFGSQFEDKWISWAIAAGGVLLTAIVVFALQGDLPKSGVITYFCWAFTAVVCSAACLPSIRRESGMVRLRWALLATSCLCKVCVFVAAGTDQAGHLSHVYAQLLISVFGGVGEALLLMAAATFYTRVSHPMVILDTLQGILFCSLRFVLKFGPREHDLFQKNHLLVTTASYGFYFVTAMAAFRGSASQPETRFLRFLSLYLGGQLISIFLMNQIGYEWQHSSLWAIAYAPLNMASAFFMMRANNTREAPVTQVRPTVFMRNLMPSFLALGNLALGLIALPYYRGAGVAAIFIAVICYVLRAGLVQGESGVERDRLSEANQRLEQLATRDALTGAGNRRSLVSAVLDITRQPNLEVFSLVLVDADWFKQANDHHGHLHGDQVLVAIADVLRSASETVQNGHCARLGGDEFAMLLPNLDSNAAFNFAENVRLRVNSLGLQAGERTISISVGATVAIPSVGLCFESLMSRADEALYRAKSLGRNRVEILA